MLLVYERSCVHQQSTIKEFLPPDQWWMNGLEANSSLSELICLSSQRREMNHLHTSNLTVWRCGTKGLDCPPANGRYDTTIKAGTSSTLNHILIDPLLMIPYAWNHGWINQQVESVLCQESYALTLGSGTASIIAHFPWSLEMESVWDIANSSLSLKDTSWDSWSINLLTLLSSWFLLDDLLSWASIHFLKRQGTYQNGIDCMLFFWSRERKELVRLWIPPTDS